MLTRRLRLKELLAAREDGYTLDELADILMVPRGVVLSDLEHLQLSLRHKEATLLMVPPACATCGFVFRVEKPKAPSRCPACRSKAIEMPVFKVASPATAEG